MRIAASLAVALLFSVAAAQAQQLEGQWVARSAANGVVIDTVVVITGQTYISNQTMYSGGATYFTSQSGEVFFNPPDNLRLVVLDWSPKDYLGQPQAMPPNTNWTIYELTDTQLGVAEPACLRTAPMNQCYVRFRRQ
ncbi:MAG: hypothetical protein HY834_08075 [Devosia nanyangense]|uniref:DUF2147 domain-containing protein n=1 Tax=Devosia nanyangense TaxID=1228055 RepID=A0A933L1Y0_9HYPH|nr:hypothetical protein [Devosia nanyangense]